MALYSVTGAANLLATNSATLSLRVEMALLKYSAVRFAAAPIGNEAAYIRKLAENPAGQSNAVVPLVAALIDVASPGTDQAPNLPTDAELIAAIQALWPFLYGG
jgi:hypothetical protein